MPEPADLLVLDAAEVATCAGPAPRRGAALADAGILRRAGVAVKEGKVLAVGPSDEIASRFRAAETIDARGRLVTPGLVDAHTHAVFAGSREEEFELRALGTPYMEIAKRGGGILSSVRAFRAAGEEALEESTRARLDAFLRAGTTTVEVKSGYGLDLESELRALSVLRRLSRSHPIDLVPTFMGAHEFPPEYRERRGDYVRLVAEEMIPAVARAGTATYCDVFCEKGVFEVEDTRAILEAARASGLALKVHAEEFECIGGAALAASLGAASADHLGAIDDRGIAALAASDTVGVLLPGTAFFLDLPKWAPARRMIEAGVAVALATDFNPGSCFTESLPMILTLAVVRLKMRPSEALVAATLNAARAIGRDAEVGSLEPGKKADLVVWDVPNHRYLPYHFGAPRTAVVVKSGTVVHSSEVA
jgi:imidazolonepropionase